MINNYAVLKKKLNNIPIIQLFYAILCFRRNVNFVCYLKKQYTDVNHSYFKTQRRHLFSMHSKAVIKVAKDKKK